MKIYLASASKRRIEILGKILKPFEKNFEIIIPEFSEKEGGYRPSELVLINARGKVDSISKKNYAEAVFISADTIVVLDEKILGKPASRQDAEIYLEMLSGRAHSVFTGVVLFDHPAGRYFEGFCESIVTFNKLSSEMIAEYISRYQPYDKAGGYGIQELGNDFINKLEGSFSNIVGLPEELTLDLLQETGLK